MRFNFQVFMGAICHKADCFFKILKSSMVRITKYIIQIASQRYQLTDATAKQNFGIWKLWKWGNPILFRNSCKNLDVIYPLSWEFTDSPSWVHLIVRVSQHFSFGGNFKFTHTWAPRGRRACFRGRWWGRSRGARRTGRRSRSGDKEAALIRVQADSKLVSVFVFSVARWLIW